MAAPDGPGYAHKGVTSPFTFADDVGPILREHCGRCHTSGGIAPMSLWTHGETVPWADSMRFELVAGHMPPWGIDSTASRFKNVKALTARELNVLLTWASGGTPAGTAATAEPGIVSRRWPLGEPDLVLRPASDFVMPADVQERVEEFTLDPGMTETRWLRAVDVLPGDPSVVRRATVSIAPDRRTSTTADTLLALWVPGDDPVPADRSALILTATERLVLRVHYRKTWQRERDVVRDRSAVGLYFAPASGGSEIHAAVLEPPRTAGRQTADGRADGRTQAASKLPEGVVRVDQPVWPWQSTTSDLIESTEDAIAFSRTLGAFVWANAIYADPGLSGASIAVEAIRPNGSRETLIAFRPQADWTRRYWFRDPIGLAEGTRIVVRATRDDQAALQPPGAIKRPPADLSAVRLTLNVVRVN
jgi:hypothetical protein